MWKRAHNENSMSETFWIKTCRVMKYPFLNCVATECFVDIHGYKVHSLELKSGSFWCLINFVTFF